MSNRFRPILALILMCLAVIAAAEGEATWSAKMDRTDIRAGEEARIVITADLKEGWHTYSIVKVDKGPFPTTIDPPTGPAVAATGPIEEQAPHSLFDPNFEKQVATFEKKAEFYAPVRLKDGLTGAQKVNVKLKFQICDANVCIPPADVEVTASFDIQPGPARPEFTKLGANSNGQPLDAAAQQIADAAKAGILPLIFLAMGFGFLSLLTPCVFPMIPITVSFFAKQKGDSDKLSFAGPVAYCLGIIGTFTGLGMLVGSTGLNKLATNVWVNVGLSVLFIVLAASLFGVFEIRLPNWLVNKASSKSRSGGLVGPLVMGLTFTLTSFTCTVPFVGTLLATSAQEGLAYTIIGMLAYSTAFALPFFLLALFPSFLAKLPRSGAWLVTVKAFMGFLELMAALKFLSNVDLTFRLGWLTRPVFLAVWAATAAVGALYLLGWVRLAHDAGDKIGWIRRGFGVATLALAIWCLGGLNGISLGSLEAFPPPDPYPYRTDAKQPKLGPGGMMWEVDYKAALAKAKASNRNVFVDFTGIYCTNCRLIEKSVLADPQVKAVLGKFVIAELYTDDGSTENDANQKLEVDMAKVNSLPLYVVVSPDGKVLKIHQQNPPLEDKDKFLKAIQPFSGP